MTARAPVWLFHFTRIEHLESITREGLVCDGAAHRPGRLQIEIGNVRIKERRRRRHVDPAPGGVVADYVPFYFAPRSPMLYALNADNVRTYRQGQDGLIYLCTTLDRVEEAACRWVGTDRNAVLEAARMTDSRQALMEMVDWPLMRGRMWKNTDAYPDRKERRQAELLVHQLLPWEAVTHIGVRNEVDGRAVQGVLDKLARGHVPTVLVRPGWYF